MADQQQPIYILPESAMRTRGRDAQRNNIAAAKIVAETVRTTLGPKGMDKMLVDSFGGVTITNDGVTILEEMQIEHPAAKMLVEVARTQENEVGDGTTTAVVLAGELLKKAEDLIDKEVHPTVIAKGYRIAADKAQVILYNMSEKITINDDTTLRNIAMTAMTGKAAESAKEKLAELSIRAIKKIIDIEDHQLKIDLENIKLEKSVGASIEDSELIEGIILDKEKVHPSMPRLIKNAKVALIDCALELKNTEIEAKISITSPEQMQSFLNKEEEILKRIADKIYASGANVVFCQKGIDDLVQHYLAKYGIYAARRIKQSDMEKLSRATKARIITNLEDLSGKDLGAAGIVEEVKINDEEMTFVKECRNPKAVTMLIKGGTQHVVDETERAIKDALGDISAALKLGRVVAGAGSTETEVARNLRKFANTLSGREQLAVLAFAEALEIIPRTLAENSGIDPIDLLTALKQKHDEGKKWAGIDVFTGRIADSWKLGVIEPLKIKTQAIKSATEVAIMILRIDDIIASKETKPQMPYQGEM
ncbi:MAG: thermosome subunit alpha [Candidatus Nanoarchaeia archaeon]|nr:thermosome subunit alpha [Candidatus Nanoarchaeia archaeon]MDD5588120.1 thermosome subunit alpha [Candidatus Nanoarchaeia archaeon]